MLGESEFTCDICWEFFDGENRRPRVLQCGHSLCSLCAEELHECVSGSLQCPTCRQKHEVKDVSQLPYNYSFEKSLSFPLSTTPGLNRSPKFFNDNFPRKSSLVPLGGQSSYSSGMPVGFAARRCSCDTIGMPMGQMDRRFSCNSGMPVPQTVAGGRVRNDSGMSSLCSSQTSLSAHGFTRNCVSSPIGIYLGETPPSMPVSSFHDSCSSYDSALDPGSCSPSAPPMEGSPLDTCQSRSSEKPGKKTKTGKRRNSLFRGFLAAVL